MTQNLHVSLRPSRYICYYPYTLLTGYNQSLYTNAAPAYRLIGHKCQKLFRRRLLVPNLQVALSTI